MADFDTVLAGRVILTDREISRGFVAIREGENGTHRRRPRAGWKRKS
jgi:hypothetical protein